MATHYVKLSLRDRIRNATHTLFDARGIQHVTVEAIAAEAQTTKMGVYRHFASKDALVEDWISEIISKYRSVLDNLERLYPDDPKEQLRGWADHIAGGLAKVSHRGCPFVNTIAEITDRNHPVRRKIEAHKVIQVNRIASLCTDAGLNDPATAAAEFTFLLEGAQISAQNGSVHAIEQHIRAMINRILET